MIEKKASDLHLKAGQPPVVRVNGQLFYLKGDSGQPQRFNPKELDDLAHALMSPHQAERYEQGMEVDLGHEIELGRFRINICRQRSNPRLVCRYIPEGIPTLAELKLPTILEQLCTYRRGLILVTGATGTGKSTTLASMVDHIVRTRSCHVVTIEDPIEFLFKDRKSIVTQREVGLDTQTFSEALKYALRQDPDVILVGEMRDEETILMALTAAETGHLVLSSLHTNDAAETINRIHSSVPTANVNQVRAQLASVLVGVVSQRLVRMKDGTGRMPALEILLNNARVQRILTDTRRVASDLTKVMEESNGLGMHSFDQCLLGLIAEDRITTEEALSQCTHPKDFELRLQGVIGGEAVVKEKSVMTDVSGEGDEKTIHGIQLDHNFSVSATIDKVTEPHTITALKKPAKED